MSDTHTDGENRTESVSEVFTMTSFSSKEHIEIF